MCRQKNYLRVVLYKRRSSGRVEIDELCSASRMSSPSDTGTSFCSLSSIFDLWTRSPLWLTWIFDPLIPNCVVAPQQYASFACLTLNSLIVGSLHLVVWSSVDCTELALDSLIWIGSSLVFPVICSSLTSHSVPRCT